MEEIVPKKIENGESFGARIGGIFRRLLDVLELKHLITKRERDYISGDISEEEFKNELSCSNCDRFGQNCGSCEVDENEESLKTWEQEHIELLTSREMGEWLYRRDMNARQQGELRNVPNLLQTQGEWIYGEDDCGQDGWFCSECGFFVPWYYQYYEKDIDFIRDYKVCPHCISEMITYTGKDRDMRGEE